MKQQRETGKLLCNAHTLLTDLKACSRTRDLQWGKRIHAKAVESRNDSNVYVLGALIKMYAKCGSMVDGRRVFDSIQKPDVVSWNALLLGYAENGDGLAALEFFSRMKAGGFEPNPVTYLAAIKACTSLAVNGDRSHKAASLERGKQIHLEIGRHLDHYVQSALIDMYGKCGSKDEARKVFDNIPKPDVVSWNALILGYVENGDGVGALELFSKMNAGGCVPNSITYIAALKACASLAVNGDASRKGSWLERGREIHSGIGCHLSHYVRNTLIDMYAKCGSMVDARRVFDTIQRPDGVSWGALLLGYAETGNGFAALELFAEMKAGGFVPNSVTYLAALKACASLAVNVDASRKAACLQRGKEIHSEIGSRSSHHVMNALIDMYAKCGSMVDARRVFEGIQKPDVVSWTTLILGYADNGQGQAALDLFYEMKARGCALDSLTYVAAIKACTSLAVNDDGTGRERCLERCREIHMEIGSCLDHYVQNTLIDMYGKCGSMVDARGVFDSMQKPDVVSWTVLIMGYAENGEGSVALDLFNAMKACGYAPNSVTYVAALKACSCLAAACGDCNGRAGCLERGREIHLEIGRQYLDQHVLSTLIDMYGKCGSMADARSVFDSIESPVVVSWNVLLLGYVENGEGLAALELFSGMKARGVAPDSVTYVAAIKACTSLASNGDGCRKRDSLERGRELHSQVGSHLDHYVESTLIDMYCKCGSMADARRLFDRIHKPVLASWNALIMGYVENGEGVSALEALSRMKACGRAPDSVTYIAALRACALTGALDLGRRHHAEIRDFTARVVTCLVDFYAKCGSIGEAREVFELHSSARTVSTWNALLAGYGSFGDTVSVFDLFETMQDKGFRPDGVTFMSLLLCCSHAGLVEKARAYFEAMPGKYGVAPTIMHYNCMVDVLGRANQLKEAMAMLETMPCNPDEVTWMALLGACHKWKDAEIGRSAFQSLVNMGKANSSAYTLMAQIYGRRGMWEEQELVWKVRADNLKRFSS